MDGLAGTRRRRGARGAVVAGVAVAGLVGTALPAFGHASIPGSAAFGFAPNTSGGTGATGASPPYVPGSTQKVFLRAPFEQTVPFNGSDDTTVDLKITVPAGFTSPVCGTANVQVNNSSTNFTNQPGPVVDGWSCEILTVNSRSVVHFSGPQVVSPATAADSVQFVSFDVTVPTPATQTTYNGKNGTEGFIADQQYASGEIVHWIPDAAFPGTTPPGATTSVAAGLARTVGGPGTKYQPVAPVRILDSRTATGGWTGQLAAGTPQSLTVTGGTASVPADVDSVVLNLTATNGSANSFLTAYPAGVATVPTASNLNFAAGETRPNLVTVKVGTAGQVTIANAVGSTDVIADLVGYYSSAAPDLYNPLDPSRVLDTRTPQGGGAPVTAGTPLDFHAHAGGVPESADAVEVNVTVTNGSANSFLTVYPAGGSTPNVSNLNFAKGQTIANLVSVKLGTDGHIAFANNTGSVDVIVDVVGYYDGGGGNAFHSLAPQRILDSRTTNGGWAAPLVSGNARNLQTAGFGGVRFDATAVVGNATVTNGTANSFLSVSPSGVATTVSNLNFAAGQTVPNLTQVKLGADGQLSFANNAGSTDVIYDVVGFFAPT